jgi:streptogramin lyase
MLSRARSLGLVAVVLAVLLAAPAGGGESSPRSAAVEIVLSVKTAELGTTFTSPWQLACVPNGTKTGAIAVTDRGGNQVGLLDPATLKTQNIRLNSVTSPGPIVVLDNTRFAIAGTGGVGIFDRAGSGKVTELAMANTRNQALALGSNGNLIVADAQQHDVRIIRPPYSGPADITKFPLPQQCRNPTGLIPEDSGIAVLCQQTNNIVRIDYTGNFGGGTLLPVANAGAQEARPSPNGFVFSGFNANRVFSYSPSYAGGFKSFALTGPAVPTVGYFADSAFDQKLAQAAARLRAGKKPTRAFFFNSFTPSFRDGSFRFGSFPSASSTAFNRLAGRNLVGSTNGPGGTIWVTDATPGRPALHRITFGDGAKTGRTKTGYRFSRWLTQTDPDFLARMTMPFTGPAPREVRVGVTGASASPWNLKPTFSDNFNLKAVVRAALPGAATYQVKVSSADTGPYARAYQFSLRPGTTSATLTFTGGGPIPASFKVDAVAEVKPCECDSLDAQLVSEFTEGPTELTLGFDWTLECTGGAGTCEGDFAVSGDKTARADGLKINLVGSDSIAIDRSGNEIQATCRGDCKGPTAPGARGAYLILKTPRGKEFGKDVRSVSIVVERMCRRPLAPKMFRVALGSSGLVSDRRSDLDGNGAADGTQRRR